MTMTLQEKIYQCRKKAGLSQEALAEKLGVSRQAVSKWETGEAAPEIGKLALLAKTFNVTADWLLSEEEEPASAEGASPNNADFTRQECGSFYDTRDSAPHGRSSQDASAAWVDAIPGVIGKLLRRYGWLFGVYMAVGGAAMSAMGLLMKSVLGHFGRTMDSMIGGFPGETTVLIDGTRVSNGFSSAMTGPGEMMGNFVLGIGLAMMVVGIVLAVVLKRQSR